MPKWQPVATPAPRPPGIVSLAAGAGRYFDIMDSEGAACFTEQQDLPAPGWRRTDAGRCFFVLAPMAVVAPALNPRTRGPGRVRAVCPAIRDSLRETL